MPCRIRRKDSKKSNESEMCRPRLPLFMPGLNAMRFGKLLRSQWVDGNGHICRGI